MVGVAQLVEPWFVVPVVAGSSPSLTLQLTPVCTGVCFASVAQLDRAPDFGSGGRVFESFRARQKASRFCEGLSLFELHL